MLKVNDFSYRHSHSDSYALKNISLRLGAGQALLLTGQSGSGKSTLLSAISGLIPHYYKGEASGEIFIDGFMPCNVPLEKIGQHVGLMLQNAETQFLAPTVEEEIFLSLKCRNLDTDKSRRLTEEQLKKFRIEHIRNSSVFNLSEGQKQKVVLAALTALKPKIILLDEPTANLDPLSIAELKEILLALKAEGVVLLIADHRLNWLNDVCESVMVLKRGQIAWQGSFAKLADDYQQLGLRCPLEQKERPMEVLDNTSAGMVARDINFAYAPGNQVITNFNGVIPYGKVTVLNGPSGMGKTTLAKVLCGLLRAQRGEVVFSDGGAANNSIEQYARIVLQNSDHQLYMNSVLAEACLAISMCPKTAQSEARAVLKQFGLQGMEQRHPHSLSGGEKQRLVVAVGVAAPPKLIILDEPTSGLDGHNLRLMSEHIRQMARNNLAVLVITHDVELINMCADYKLRLG